MPVLLEVALTTVASLVIGGVFLAIVVQGLKELNK